MHKLNEDCFYFLTSSCAKGSACPYRHSPLALTCNVICPSWTRGNCLAPACPFRHTAVQRPTVSNGILCFYENTPMGCLKPDCTFIHSRPRIHSTIRPASTNLINKDVIKSPVPSTPPTDLPPITNATAPNNNASQPAINETQSVVTVEPSSNVDIPSSIVKIEPIPRRIAVSSDSEQLNEKLNSSDNKKKSTTRSVITTNSPKRNQEELTTTQSRLIVNRNVVVAESSSVPTRKIVQTTSSSSSNRVVVSSETINSPSKGKKNNLKSDDSIEQENDIKKFKKDSQSTPSGSNRLLLTSSNEAKPIRLNRHRLSAAKTSSGNSPISVSTPTKEEKTSAGTGLSQDDKRRTSRIERFKNNPISPPRSTICSSTTNNNMTVKSSITRNIITSTTPGERKRTAPETTMKDSPPSKRVLTASSSRQTTSSVNVLPIRANNWKKQANELITKTAQPKKSSLPTNTVRSESVTSPSVRPRFTPQPITPPSPLQSSRPRQPPSVVIKRPLVPPTTPTQTSTKPIEQVAETNTPPPKSSIELQPSNIPDEEDENQLLTFTESSDVVDTFALIDEALLEADHFLELI